MPAGDPDRSGARKEQRSSCGSWERTAQSAGGAMAEMPGLRALMADRGLPDSGCGPVDFRASRRLGTSRSTVIDVNDMTILLEQG